MSLPNIQATSSYTKENLCIHNANPSVHNINQPVILPPVAPQQMENPEQEKSHKSLSSSLLGMKLIEEHKEDLLTDFMQEQHSDSVYNCLNNHKISPLLRAKMVNWMIEVFSVYQCKDQCFFKAVFIMDLYYAKTTM